MLSISLELERVKLAKEQLQQHAQETCDLRDWHCLSWVSSSPELQQLGLTLEKEGDELVPQYHGNILGINATLRGYPALMAVFGLNLSQAQSLFAPRGESIYDIGVDDLSDYELVVHRFEEFLKDHRYGG